MKNSNEKLNELYEIYDSINTLAVRWLVWNANERKVALGIKDFKANNKSHMWFLNIMNNYSVASGYKDFYLDSSFRDYFFIRWIKHFSHAHMKEKDTETLFIEPDIFIREVTEHFNVNPEIVEDIYDAYWRKEDNG